MKHLAAQYNRLNYAENRVAVTYFNIGESGVSQTIRRVSDRLIKDKKLTRKINRIKNKLLTPLLLVPGFRLHPLKGDRKGL